MTFNWPAFKTEYRSLPRPTMKWAGIICLIWSVVFVRDAAQLGIIVAFLTALYKIRADEKAAGAE